MVLIDNFDNFHRMAFKLNEHQTIHGQWELNQAVVEGELRFLIRNIFIYKQNLIPKSRLLDKLKNQRFDIIKRFSEI